MDYRECTPSQGRLRLTTFEIFKQNTVRIDVGERLSAQPLCIGMNKETRIQKISEIVERDKANPYGKVDIPWRDTLEPMPVFKIPLSFLIYNKYNGRILSRTKTLETQNKTIDAATEDGSRLLEKLLYDSDSARNNKTLKSLSDIGQEKVGIITRDGIIIDGNRRAMLLNRINAAHPQRRIDYFKTVVLPVTLEEDPLEIEKLETTYQMGEDEKLTYNPIEKYLKAKGLKSRGIHVDQIAAWMGETPAEVQQYLDVMTTMEDYLDYTKCNGIYTQLDGREDQFITLTKQLTNFRSESSRRGFPGYQQDDVDDLKIISYDYIRVRYEGKEFRWIGQGNRDSHFFGDKEIWRSFSKSHFEKIKPLRDAEPPIDMNSENIELHLKERDHAFLEASKFGKNQSSLEENLDVHRQKIYIRKRIGAPDVLAATALDNVRAIQLTPTSPNAAAVLDKVEKLSEFALKILNRKAPDKLLGQVVELLQAVDIESLPPDRAPLLMRIKEVQRIAYQIEKGLKAH